MQHQPHHHLVNRLDLSHLITCPEQSGALEYNPYLSALNVERNYILISGSYDESNDNDILCTYLGCKLAKLNLGVVSGAGKAGLMVSYGLYDCLYRENRHDPETIIFYSRRKKRAKETATPPIGTTKFYGTTPREMRAKMISKVKAVILIGGSVGTYEEEEFATRNNLRVIPIARSGGTAHEIWEKYRQLNYKQSKELGWLDAENFDALGSEDLTTSLDAAIALLTNIPGIVAPRYESYA